MEEKGKIHKLVDSAGNYIESSIDILKLQTADRISKILASVISDCLMIMVVFMCILFVSLGLAFFLADMIGSTYAGFMMTGGIYLLIGFILLMMKSNGMEKFFRNRIIQKMFDEKDNDNKE